MARITILGAGNWGTALAWVAGRAGHDVCLWTRDSLLAQTINRDRRNPRLITGELSSDIRAETDLPAAVAGREIVVLASPSHVLREQLVKLQPSLTSDVVFVSAAKGIENDTLMRISEIAADVLGPTILSRFVVLSGPSFAREVVEDHPTAITAASRSADAAQRIQTAFSAGNFRVYTHDDVVGTELGGSVKNVVAIAAGMVSGLGLGHNTVAALITRGLAEIGRLAAAAGGKPETLMGLAGLGDLVLTCTGGLSRNRRVGFELARGRNLAEISADMSEVAEGVRTTASVHQLAARTGIEMPITAEVFAVLYGHKSPKLAAESLMERPLRQEF